MLATKGMRFPIDVILVCIRWYAAYPLSYRHLEEMMHERGVFVVILPPYERTRPIRSLTPMAPVDFGIALPATA